MSKKSESDGRQAGEFTEEEGRIHQAGFTVIFSGMEKGLGFDEACSGLAVVDPEMRRVIIEDYLKVTIAERHFQDGRTMEEVADTLKIPVERIAAIKEEMLREVQEAARAVYRSQAGDTGFDESSVPESDGGKKEP
jgi:DNA-directed RNA polymerase sigma subunit (sigma70/sigma32)